MFVIKYNRTSYHIDGMATRTKSTGQDTGTGAVPYYAESVCGALTRGRFCDGPSGEDIAEILERARLSARVNNMKMCRNCESAAEQIIAQQGPDLAEQAAAKLTGPELEALKAAVLAGRF